MASQHFSAAQQPAPAPPRAPDSAPKPTHTASPPAPAPAKAQAQTLANAQAPRDHATYPWQLRFAWLLALVLGVLAYVATFVLMLLTGNPMMLPTVLLVGAAAIPLTVLLLAQSSRVGPLVPTRIVLVTAALGGLFAICAAGLEESIAGLLFGRASILLVGIIEESAKLVVPLLVLALAHRVTRGGGIVIGIAAGTGFAVLETMGYGFAALLSRLGDLQNGQLGALDATLILRGILVPAGHVAWTGAICAALWYLVETSHKVRGVIALVAAYAGAIILHTAWDATASGALHVLIGVISVGALLWLIVAAHRRFVRRVAPAAGAGPAPESRGEVRE